MEEGGTDALRRERGSLVICGGKEGALRHRGGREGLLMLCIERGAWVLCGGRAIVSVRVIGHHWIT